MGEPRRNSDQELDLLHRSKKKVKVGTADSLPDTDMPPLENNGPMDSSIHAPAAGMNFKETLLKNPTLVRSDDDDLFSSEEQENRWYKDETDDDSGDESFDPCPEIKVTPQEFADWCKPWKESLVVHLLGKKVSFRFMAMKLQQKWGKHGEVRVVDLPSNHFLVSFAKKEDYHFALFEGPWMIADHYLIVERWRPFFLESAKTVKKCAVWVRLPNLTWELWNPHFLWRVGAKLGTMLKIDDSTSIHTRGRFARICVEINLSKKLIPVVRVLGRVIQLEYEGLHQVCFSCGRYGHRADQCPENPPAVNPDIMTPAAQPEPFSGAPAARADVDVSVATPPQIPEADPADISQTDANQIVIAPNTEDVTLTASQSDADLYGPWMIVRKSRKKKVNRPRMSRNVNADSVVDPHAIPKDNGPPRDPSRHELNVPTPTSSDIPHQHMSGDTFNRRPNVAQRVRDPRAGKNKQTPGAKPKVARTTPVATLSTSLVTPVGGHMHASSSSSGKDAAAKDHQRQQEQRMLERMRLLAKQSPPTSLLTMPAGAMVVHPAEEDLAFLTKLQQRRTSGAILPHSQDAIPPHSQDVIPPHSQDAIPPNSRDALRRDPALQDDMVIEDHAVVVHHSGAARSC